LKKVRKNRLKTSPFFIIRNQNQRNKKACDTLKLQNCAKLWARA